MELVAAAPNAIFLGQAVVCPGTAMHGTLERVPAAQRLELPVAEEMQLGMSIGLALAGHLPISIYPRFNFLILAMNQLVNHLDALPLYSQYRPRVIVRTAVATAEPLDPGPQHLGDYTAALRSMLRTVRVVDLDSADKIVPEYVLATARAGSTLLVERSGMYDK